MVTAAEVGLATFRRELDPHTTTWWVVGPAGAVAAWWSHDLPEGIAPVCSGRTTHSRFGPLPEFTDSDGWGCEYLEGAPCWACTESTMGKRAEQAELLAAGDAAIWAWLTEGYLELMADLNGDPPRGWTPTP